MALTGKSHASHITVDVDDYADVIRDISPSVTDVLLPITQDGTDVTGYSDGVINVTMGQPNQPLTISGHFDTTDLVGAHTVLSRLVGNISDSVTVTVNIGIRATPAATDPEYEGLFYCTSLVYDGSLNFVSLFEPATSTAPAWGTA
jgi:hypothetical protein